ncbi:hypothetical protein HMPREF7215_0726 [Pyramidobacter piscolens W5455]|uniref:Uncharacterized protein n=1 Tax=Pyramidobacter piscolens W5455 TaxID=352165 RepID=A0ABM9ZUP5_9BACT|nr:hypothetical protein HMPREF7215_0726 [Pyramidobacter piscolens W5455]
MPPGTARVVSYSFSLKGQSFSGPFQSANGASRIAWNRVTHVFCGTAAQSAAFSMSPFH